MAKAIDNLLSEPQEQHFGVLGGYASLWVDLGTEFHNKHTLAVCKKYNIKLYSTFNSKTKAVFAERVLRTVKGKIYRALTHYNTKNYIQFLQRIVDSYNASPHRGLLGDTPNNVHAMTDPDKIEILADAMYEQFFF